MGIAFDTAWLQPLDPQLLVGVPDYREPVAVNFLMIHSTNTRQIR
jgi:hypothetical protein